MTHALRGALVRALAMFGALLFMAHVAAHPALAADLVRPDHARTPGAINPAVTQANIQHTICVPGWTKTIRPPASYTDKLKREQLKAWKYADQNPKDWEEDHRLPLESGGAPRDEHNLWTEPWHGPWNAHDKDRLENYVHRSICAGKMTLEQGRTIFLGDWIDAYEKYFGTEKPHAAR